MSRVAKATWASPGPKRATNLAIALWSKGDLAEALAAEQRALDRYRAAGDESWEVAVLCNLETIDPDKRIEYYAQAQRIITDQAYTVPLYHFPLNYATNPSVEFDMPVDGLPRLNELRWK